MRQKFHTGSGRGEVYGRKALYPRSGNVAIEIPENRGQVPVRPRAPAGVMDVEESDGEAADGDDGDGALRLDAPVERLDARPDERELQRLADPRLPSQSEVDLHDLTHLPYRNWCPVCVQCRGRDLDHRKALDEVRGVSEYAFDYCFPGDELGFKMAVLIGRERITGAYFATAVPQKGSLGRFAVDKAVDFIHGQGDTSARTIVKTDQEPATCTGARDLVEAREEGRTIVEKFAG